jgi:tripartite-type tricarboxylate transporter receptor subunit TctC
MATSRLSQSRRRALLRVATSAGAVLAPSLLVRAQAAYPSKPVRVIVPYSAGGGADTLARAVFGKLSEKLGQQFVIDNRPGGGATIGAGIVAKAAPDGYTILYDATAFSVNPALFPKLPYDTQREFQPVFLVGLLPLLLVVNPAVQVKNVNDVIATGKAAKDGLEWASAGNGSVQHLALELFEKQAGIKLNHVAYKGGAPALTDLVAGHVKYYFSNTAASSSYVKAGTIRALAHTGKGRLSTFPELPAVADTLPGFEAYEWNGVFVPAGTPAPIVSQLNAALNDVLKEAAVRDRFAQLSVQSRPNTPAEFAAFVKAETDKWGKVVRDGNIKPD